MTHNYKITGMTCGSCVNKVKSELLKIGDVTEANVQLQAPQATISMAGHIPTSKLQEVISKAGAYTITMDEGQQHQMETKEEEKKSWLHTYKPILIIGAYITGATLLLEAFTGGFNPERWMHHFMAGFFLTFSFFKMLDLKGFSESYSTYDIIAKKWMGWGYVYAFIELGLGLAFLLGFQLLAANIVTFIVMSLALVGVAQSLLAKRAIKCACLGAVFNLPMSTITVIEDVLMIGMSVIGIISLS